MQFVEIHVLIDSKTEWFNFGGECEKQTPLYFNQLALGLFKNDKTFSGACRPSCADQDYVSLSCVVAGRALAVASPPCPSLCTASSSVDHPPELTYPLYPVYLLFFPPSTLW